MKINSNNINSLTICLAVLLSGLAFLPARALGAFVAVNDAEVLTGGVPVIFDPRVNDSDSNNFPLTITSVSQPSLGNVAWTGTSITYTPNINFRNFSGADSFTYTITDGIGTASAQVTVGNPFYLQKGNFAGILNNPGGGYLTLTTTASGSFTGKLRSGSARAVYSLNGVFPSSGSWSGTVGGFALALQFDTANLTGSMRGQYKVTGAYNGIAFTAYHALYNSTSNPAPEVGSYTILFPAASGTDPATPSGTGFATMTVTESGNVNIAGTLADGTIFSDGVFITGGTDALSNNFPIYVSLGYTVHGSLTGSVRFEDIPGVSDCDGSATWAKLVQTNNPKLYPNGFTTSLTAIGSRYTRPPFGTLALNLSGSNPNASVLLTEPDFPVPIHHQLFISHGPTAGTDHVLVTDPGADALALSINAGNGTFTGSFIHPLTAKSVSISGALLHKQTGAAGLFLGPKEGGNVSIRP